MSAKTSAVRIVLVNLSSPVDGERLEAGKNVLNDKFGPIEFIESPGLLSSDGYLAGPDESRARDAAWAFKQDADMVWAVRGGFGVTRIIGRIDIRDAASSGMKLLGYSDLTPLLAAYHMAGGRALHAPMPGADLHLADARSIESLGRVVFRNEPDEFIFDGCLTMGSIAGKILPGNIVMLASLAGTDYLPCAEDHVIFLEEVGEEPYRVDRALTQLLTAGFFRGARAVVFGSMKECVPEDPSKSRPIEEVLHEFAERVSLPVCVGFPFGHASDNTTLPFGGTVGLEKHGSRVRARIAP